MQKIAQKCLLGKVVKKALSLTLPTSETEDIWKTYSEIFSKTIAKYKEEFMFVDLKGSYVTVKQYPEDDYNQAQDILLSNVQIKSDTHLTKYKVVQSSILFKEMTRPKKKTPKVVSKSIPKVKKERKPRAKKETQKK